MRLNTISAQAGSRQTRKRVGRGIGSTLGKTCGRGHKGQKARSGGYHKVGFEGGQMPLQRRIPKFGFISRKARTRFELSLRSLAKIAANLKDKKEIDILTLESLGVINKHVSKVKIILSGEITVPVNLKGIDVTPAARKAIEQAGGKVA
jgi:large subunit ribosomal protein L15